jgi:hypothetical protein
VALSPYDDGGIVFCTAKLGDKGLINFYSIEWKSPQVAKGRVACPEIVQGNPDPELLQTI